LYSGSYIDITYYVDGTNGNNANDGLTKQTAFATIQYAIDDFAQDGDTVLVCPGTYAEAIDFYGKAITVASESYPAVISVPGDLGVSFFTAEGADSVLRNFVIEGCSLGIFLSGAYPTIENVTVANNNFGIAAYGGSAPDISNSIFYNNTNGDLFGCTAYDSWVESEVASQLENGLVGYWDFDGDAADSAGTNDGTIYGATITTGQVGGALTCDGDMDYVTIPDNDSLTPRDEMTIAFWLYTNGGQNAGIYKYAGCPLQGPNGNSRAYFIEVNGSSGIIGSRIYTNVDSYGRIYSNNPVSFSEWHHISLTFNRGNAAIYIDGQLDNSETLSVSSIMNDGQPFMIGAFWDYCLGGIQSKLDGMIDEVMLYDRALSEAEISQLYTAGAAGENLSADPGFADANSGNYHLLSDRGRYEPLIEMWVLDDTTSVCVDGGSSDMEPVNEPMPNGGRVNLGAFGNTAYASMSEWPIRGDLNYDGSVNFYDMAIIAEQWLDKLDWYEN